MSNQNKLSTVTGPLIALGGFLPGAAYLLYFGVDDAYEIGWVAGTWFPVAALLLYLVRCFRPVRGRVLFLRRFHTENPPNYPLSRVFSVLGGDGYETVTLADTAVQSDDSSILPVAGIVAMVVAWLMLVPAMTACLLIVFFIVAALLSFVAAAVMVAVLMVTIFVYPWPLRRETPLFARIMTSLMEWIARRLVARLPKLRLDLVGQPYTPGMLAQRRLRRRWQLGTLVIRSSDEDWKSVVSELIKSSSIVCIDIANPSANIMTEIAIMAQEKTSDALIWMGPNPSSLASITVDDHGYSVFGIHFVGSCNRFYYRDGDNTALYRWLDGGSAIKTIRTDTNDLLSYFPTV